MIPNAHLAGFFKRCLLKSCPFHWNDAQAKAVRLQIASKPHEREKEKEGKREEKKKRLLALRIFILPPLNDKRHTGSDN